MSCQLRFLQVQLPNCNANLREFKNKHLVLVWFSSKFSIIIASVLSPSPFLFELCSASSFVLAVSSASAR